MVRDCAGKEVAESMVAPVPIVPKVPLNIFSPSSAWKVNGVPPSMATDTVWPFG